MAVVAAAAAVGPASASQLIARNARSIHLYVAKVGVAKMTYVARGKRHQVLAWGAVNATFPRPGAKQREFEVNYANGFHSKYASLGKHFPKRCGRYDGPKLRWVVAACKAPDGSYWVLQAWRRALPNYGFAPNAREKQPELRLSHWSGPLPVFIAKRDWSYAGRWRHFYGSLVYRGHPLYGFKTDRYGAPLDKFGVLLYLDTFNSRYGRGWRRENSFVTHRGSGVFCYDLVPHRARGALRPAGKGKRYRITVNTPGVLPDLFWQGNDIGPYDKPRDDAANQDQELHFRSGACRPS